MKEFRREAVMANSDREVEFVDQDVQRQQSILLARRRRSQEMHMYGSTAWRGGWRWDVAQSAQGLAGSLTTWI